MISYPCTGCGACCRRVDQVAQAIPAASDPASPLFFPYRWNEAGRCENLTEDNKCAVYASRPLLCDTDRLIAYFGLDKEEAYAISIRTCNAMMDEEDLPQEFRIQV